MRTLPKIASSLTAVALLFGIGSAQAALVNFTLTGVVDSAQADNIYGLKKEGTVSVAGIFDDSVLSSGLDEISFAPISNSLTVTAGSYSFTKADDNDFETGHYPTILLTNGKFDGFDFAARAGTSGSFHSQPLGFYGNDDNNKYISGSWTPLSFSMTPVPTSAVPIPAAAWLFGSGLLGLVGVARRKVAA